MSISNTATVTLTVNGAQAKQVMDDLRNKITQTEASITQMQQAMADPKLIERAKKQLANYRKQLAEMESATKGVDHALANIDKATPRQLEKALRTLNRQLKDMVPGSEVWNEHIEKIKELKERIAELKEETNTDESLWERFLGWSQDVWPALDLVSGWYDSVVSKMREYVDAYAEMDQEMANVMKFTGMSKKEVQSLNEDLKKIDTRTPREELNKLAQEAGRLGKTSQEDVLGFVRAADKINVALDDLGNGATLTLSKLTGIFGDEAVYGTEQSLLKVGSVINELSQNCYASAPYLANFTERMGGVGAQSGMTIQQIMGFGAVLDSNSQKVEASATALSQVIVRLYQDPAKYAKVAGLDAEKFAKLMREDANAALILFLETLQKAGGMDVLSPMFKDMGENGSRAIAALSTLATHIDQVKAQQEAANIAFDEGISIDNEFAVQNGTVQASLEKCKNAANELKVALGEKLQPIMSHLLVTTSSVIRAILVVINYVQENIRTIVTITAATTAYIVVAKLHALWLDRVAIKTMLVNKASAAWAVTQKALSGVVAVVRLAVAALTNTVQYFTNGLNVNYSMQQRWRRSMEAMKFTTWAGLILVVASAVYLLYQRMTSLTKAQKAMKDAEEQANNEIAETVTKIRTLQAAIEDNNRSLWARHTAIVQMKAVMEDYNGTLDEEGRLINHNTKLIDEYIKKLRERALASAMEDQMKESYKRLVEQGMKILDHSKGEQAEKFREDLMSGNISQNMFMRGKRVRGGDAAGMSGAKTYAPSGEYQGMRTSSWGIALPWAEDGAYTAVHKFNEELEVFMTLSKQVDENVRNSIGEKQEESKPKVNKERYESDEEYKKAVDQLTHQLRVEILQNGRDEQKMDAAEYRYQLALHELNTKKSNKLDEDSIIIEPSESGHGRTDPLAKEKEWKEQQEAITRISYATGQTNYKEHTNSMNEIAVEYYRMILERTDLSETERLKYEADFAEASKKQSDAFRAQSVEEEDEYYQSRLYVMRENYRRELEEGDLTAAERQRLDKVYKEAEELAELEHLARLVELYREGSAERLKAQQDFQAASINAQKRHQQEYERQEAEFAKAKEKYFGDNPQERQQKYDAAFAVLQSVYARELAAAGDNAAEKLRIEEAFLAAQAAMRKEYALDAEEDSRGALERAVDASVEWLNSDGGKALTGTTSTVISGMSSIFSGLSTMMQAEVELQTAAIEKRYDREVELAQGNSYKVAQLEKKKEVEIAKVKNEANRKMFAMQVIQAVAQTAQNALSAYGSAAAIPVVGHVLAPVAAAMAVAAGMIQVASIKKQQQASEAKGYSKGGFTPPGGVDEPAGVVHAGEWIASQKLLASPVARPMIEALDYVQRTNTIGSLRAEDVSRSITAPVKVADFSESENGMALMAAVASRLSTVMASLNERLNEPFVTVNTVTGDTGIKQAQDEYTKLMNNVTPKSRRKWKY